MARATTSAEASTVGLEAPTSVPMRHGDAAPHDAAHQLPVPLSEELSPQQQQEPQQTRYDHEKPSSDAFHHDVTVDADEDPDDEGLLLGGSQGDSLGGSVHSRPLPSLHAPMTYRDVRFLGLYALQLLLLWLALHTIRANMAAAADREPPSNAELNPDKLHANANGDEEEELETQLEMNASEVGIQLRSLGAVNMLFSVGWLLLFVFTAKRRFLQSSYVFSAAGLAILAFVLFTLDPEEPRNGGALPMALLVTATVIMDACWLHYRQNGLDFVAVLFELVEAFLASHATLALVTVATLVAYTVWVCWLCTHTLAFVGNGVSPWHFAMLVVYFHFYWTANIFKNILTCVVSGATIMWYYKEETSSSISSVDSPEMSPELSPDTLSDHVFEDEQWTNDRSDGEPASQATPTTATAVSGGNLQMAVRWLRRWLWQTAAERRVVLHYLKHALSSSLGSICIGSLLCPVAHIFWNVLRWARRDESPALARRLVAALRSERVTHFIRTYHKYSFVHVAGYGKPFYVAAQDSWALLEARGVEALVDDDLTSRFLLLGANGWAGVMCALCVPAFAGTHHVIFFALTSFVLCYTTLSIATHVMGAVVKTLFVCFAEHPTQLSQLHPLIYHRFARLSELQSFRDHKPSPDL